jgi:hypothetical protein
VVRVDDLAPGRSLLLRAARLRAHVNQATDEHKEAIKVGYDVRRKVVLMSVWAALPLVLWAEPALFGAIEPAASLPAYLHDVGIAWLAHGGDRPRLRVVQIVVAAGSADRAGVDDEDPHRPLPRHRLYHKAPLHLLRGELIDPMAHVRPH